MLELFAALAKRIQHAATGGQYAGVAPQLQKVMQPSNWEAIKTMSPALAAKFLQDLQVKINLSGANILQKELASLLPKLLQAYQRIQQNRADLTHPASCLNLPYVMQQELPRIVALAQRFRREKIRDVFIVGIGGSSLAGQVLHTCLNHHGHNLLPLALRDFWPRIHFVGDNFDPEQLAGPMLAANFKKTALVLITKSRGTAEALACFLPLYKHLVEVVGEEQAAKRCALITADVKAPALLPENDLLRVAENKGFEIFLFPRATGGRFSVFTHVGLLPAQLTGIDCAELLAGARAADERCQNHDLLQNPAYMLAGILHLAYTQKGKDVFYLMPFANALRHVSEWCVQLIAESLGKADETGTPVGPIPVAAMGTTDLHSVFQLLLGGPRDKLVLFSQVTRLRTNMTLTDIIASLQTSNLANHTLGHLLLAAKYATEAALTQSENPVPNITFDIPEIRAYTLGQVLQIWMTTVAVWGELLGLGDATFTQNLVEAYKHHMQASIKGQPGAVTSLNEEYEALRGEKTTNPFYV